MLAVRPSPRRPLREPDGQIPDGGTSMSPTSDGHGPGQGFPPDQHLLACRSRRAPVSRAEAGGITVLPS